MALRQVGLETVAQRVERGEFSRYSANPMAALKTAIVCRVPVHVATELFQRLDGGEFDL